MGSLETNKIEQPHIILCEGKDEFSFLFEYVKHLVQNGLITDTFQIFDFGGIKDLSRQFKIFLRMPNYDIVKTILIIRDAEKNPDGAIQSVCSTLKNNGFQPPSYPGDIVSSNDGVKATYLLFPALSNICNTPGTLEDLCLDIVSEDNYTDLLDKIDNYIDLIKTNYNMKYPRLHKNRLHMLISSYDKYVDAKAGEAGARGMYDWNSPRLEFLKGVLIQMDRL